MKESLVTDKVLWYVLLMVITGGVATSWLSIDNHQYLIAYWVLICWVTAGDEREGAMLKWNGHLLVGSVFAVAVIWKLVGGEYIDGSFWHYQLLTEPRLQGIVALIGGVSAEVLELNREIVRNVMDASEIGVQGTLTSSPTLRVFAMSLSVGGLVLESAIAVAFLIPSSNTRRRVGNWCLWIFIVATYLLVPVLGFATILGVLGLAQSETARQRLVYLLVIGLVQLAEVPWTEYVGTAIRWM